MGDIIEVAATISAQDAGWVILKMPKAIVVLSREEFNLGLQRGKWWQRQRSGNNVLKRYLVSILDENPYNLPLDEPELLRALRRELSNEENAWLIAWHQAWLEELKDELARRQQVGEGR